MRPTLEVQPPASALAVVQGAFFVVSRRGIKTGGE